MHNEKLINFLLDHNTKQSEEGYADSVTYPPDVAKANLFKDAKRAAKEAEVGLWGDVCK